MSGGIFSKDKLVFDPASALDSDNIGSYTRSGSSGAQITNHATQKPSAGSITFLDADVTPGTDSIAEASHGLQTGDKVQLSSTGVLPAGLSLATDYFVIRVDANNIKLASSIANAEAGIAVDITAAAGGGTHSLDGQEQEVRALDVWISNPSLAVSGTVELGATTLAALETITVEQGTSPWVVSATDLDIRDLVFATDKVDVTGSEVSLDAATLAALETITVEQGTSPWVIGDGGGSITVDGTVSISGDVNVTQGTSPWVVQAGAEKAEDAAHASGDIGNFILAVRNDVEGSLVSTDGDYAPLQVDALGRLRVAADIDVVTGAEKAEDAVHTSGDIGSYVLAVRQDTLANSVSADGDYASLKVDSLGRLWTSAAISGDVADDDVDSGNPIKVGFRAYSGPLASVSAGDRVNGASDLYRRLYVNNGSNIAIEDTQVDVDSSAATAVPAAALAGRRTVMIQNLSSKEVYVGKTGVTSANGFVLGARATISLDLGPDISVFVRGSVAAAQDIRVLELA